MADITGTTGSNDLVGTSGDDYFDGKGGDDVIDGGDGNDTILIFEDSSTFDISTLAGVTKIYGNYGSGDYSYDTITATNVESIQFADKTVSLSTDTKSIIDGTTGSNDLVGTSGDDYFDGKGGDDVIDGGDGNDTILIFEDSSTFDISTLAGVTK